MVLLRVRVDSLTTEKSREHSSAADAAPHNVTAAGLAQTMHRSAFVEAFRDCYGRVCISKSATAHRVYEYLTLQAVYGEPFQS